ncbi:MAG: hypothetical protein H7A23_24555 [Leptospiraceae bacterium]|nr:hypothetical protein [Leptospiraceae bacterium]MCP5497737.1 hypothetical protein [Leptospiraceae bacterium]
MRKSNRRKKVEATPSSINSTPVKVEGDRPYKVYQTITVSIDWDSFQTKQKVDTDLRNQLIDLYYKLQDDPKDVIEPLEQILNSKSGVPIVQLYLENAYRNTGESQKANELATEMFKKFPDTLIGKTAYISFSIDNNDLESIPKILENKFDYKELYPNRNSFHIFEVISFLFAMGKYFTLTGEPEKATIYLEQITKIDPDNHYNKELEKFISKKQGKENIFKRTIKKFKKSKKEDTETEQ